MGRLNCSLAAILVSPLIVAYAQSARANVVADCNSGNQERVMRGCSIVIGSGLSAPMELTTAYANRARASQAAGHPGAALADLSAAIELNPSLAGLYSNRGNIYFAEGKIDRALADYSRAIELNPGFAGAYFNRGNLYSRVGKLAAAVADLTAAVHLNPKYAPAYFNRAIVYFRMGQRKDAISDFRQTLKLDPSHRGAARALFALRHATSK
jgi:tetratricopeptide (TPR) repeat protein